MLLMFVLHLRFLYVQLFAFVSDSESLVEGILATDRRELLEKYVEKTAGVLEILRRDRMKVVFFGRSVEGAGL